MKTSTEEKVDDAILMAEVMAGAREPVFFYILTFYFPGDGCRGGTAGGAGGEAEGAGGALHPLHHGQAGAQVNL